MSNMMCVSLAGESYRACLVVDSVLNNTSSGGVRIAEDVAVEEVAALASEMSLKYAFFRLPRGGAKMGISIPSDVSAEEEIRILREVGWKLGPIIRASVYNPGMDMNCGPEKLKAIYAGAGIRIGDPTDTSFFTALSVHNAVEACYEELGTGETLSVAIEGFGRVAGHLASRLSPNKYKIVAISTVTGAIRNPVGFDSRLLAAKRNEVGDQVVRQVDGEKITNAEVFTEPVDILIPSSRTWAIRRRFAEQFKAKAVVPIANAPYEEGTLPLLQQRRVLCLPGFVTNAGGVFGSSLYDAGLPADEVAMLVERHYRPVVEKLLCRSRGLGLSPVAVAESVAHHELDARKRQPDTATKLEKVRRRLMPHLPMSVRRYAVRKRFIENMGLILRDLEGAAE